MQSICASFSPMSSKLPDNNNQSLTSKIPRPSPWLQGYISNESSQSLITQILEVRGTMQGVRIDDQETVKIFPFDTPAVDSQKLEEEINLLIARCIQEKGISIPQQIIRMALEPNAYVCNNYSFTEIAKIKAAADTLVTQSSGVILPGGPSILPKFYGQSFEEEESREGYLIDSQRSMMEFCLINACETQGKPLLAICRGHQALNVYRGGILDRESVGNLQNAVVRATKIDQFAQSKFIENPNKVFFYHFQTVVKLGEGLTSTFKLDALRDINNHPQKASGSQGSQLEEVFGSRENYFHLLNKIAVDPTEKDRFLQMKREEAYNNFLSLDMEMPEIEQIVNGIVVPEIISLLEAKLEGPTPEEVTRILNFLEDEQVVMAVDSQYGAPMIGVQFHPEAIYKPGIMSRDNAPCDQGNRQIFEVFAAISRAQANKQRLNQQFLATFGIPR